MKNTKLSVMMVLSILMVFGALPLSGYAKTSEIWPGYPGVDQLTATDTIPNPFEFFNPDNDPNGDGYVSDPTEWTARRNEIKDLVQRYWLGYRWPTKAENVIGETKDVVEPNDVTYVFWNYNLRDEFDKLVAKLETGTVEIHDLLVTNGYGATKEGDLTRTFGPAKDQAEAEALAIEAWNAGYYLPPNEFYGSEYRAVMNTFTGPITEPPGKTRVVLRNVITITNPDTGIKASFYIYPTMPKSAVVEDIWGDPNAQVPVIIDIGGVLSAGHIATINKLGYGYIKFTPTDIYPDDTSASDGINRDGVYTKLYPYIESDYKYASGALMAWNWAVSQILNALEQPTPDMDNAITWGKELGADPARTLVTGHSRYGKAALFAGAFDDRISICFPSESGGSGTQSYRYKVAGKIFNFNTYPKADRVYGVTEIPTISYGSGSSWFPDTAGAFLNKDNKLPFDPADIISLVAPRPFITTSGIDSHWLGNEGNVASVVAASEVYDFIGKNEIEKTNAAIRVRESNHALYNRDLPFIVAIMDREFKQTGDKTLHVRDLYPAGDGSLNSMSYPATDYNYISEFNSYPFDINSSYMPWSSANKYVLWTAQENFLVGHPVTITAYSNAPKVNLYTPDGTVIDPSSHNGFTFDFDLTADQAIYGRYELRTIGNDKDNRSVFFAAVSIADALRHATSKGDEGEENRLIGFSSRVANTPEDPPKVYIDGKQTTMSFTPNRFPEEETTLLEYGVNFHNKLFARIANEGWDASKTFDIKNLKFVTIPGFTFEISFANIYASAANSGKDGADKFTQPISWNVEKYNNGPAPVWPPIPDNKAEKDTLKSGGTVIRPDAPEPKATAFNAKIVDTDVEHVGDKTNVTVTFDQALDPHEFGFGVNVADNWDTSWSADNKQVTLSIDYDRFPEGSDADIIIFRLKDTAGNIIPGPIYLTLNND